MTLERIHLPLSLLLLLLLLSLLLQPGSSQISTCCRETRVQRFWRLHVDNPKSFMPGGVRQYCTAMIQRRQISDRGNCKHENTFIHAVAGAILDVCKSPRIKPCRVKTKKCHLSDHVFRQTLCILQGLGYFPNCTYMGFLKFKKITLACAGNPEVPVYLDP
ncbi:ribonuclease 4-like [Dromiciops gliroides]|uniref:ribonuclease 4-like n=1 Tax=Dromiciops gliroides TaxID=33562 RepID=UPI001CC3FCF3|nr:ribonuclease 4-like [Dromiciops gliroides]